MVALPERLRLRRCLPQESLGKRVDLGGVYGLSNQVGGHVQTASKAEGRQS